MSVQLSIPTISHPPCPIENVYNSINPLDLLILATDIEESIHDIRIKQEYSTYKAEFLTVRKQILSKTFAYTCRVHSNQKFINEIINILRTLPPILNLTQTKPIIPIFHEILTKSTDSAEIKKFIRKANYDFIGYHCNHEHMNQQCDQIIKNTSDLHKHQDFVNYMDCMNTIISNAHRIIHADKLDIEFKWDEDYTLQYCNFTKVSESIVHLNAKITEYNSKTNHECSKCESAQRKYNYVLREIAQMRGDHDDYIRIRTETQNNPHGMVNHSEIVAFMNKHFSMMDSIPLKEVKQRWKLETGNTVNQSEFKLILENTGIFKIVNRGNIFHAVRK